MKQPFADLLISGRKTIELRSWNTRFRGKFLVHASLKPDIAACIAAGVDPYKLARGAIIGRAFLYDVKKYNDREAFLKDRELHLAIDYANPKYGFMIKDPIRFDRPIPAKGKLNFFEVEM